ncbi:MAG: PaaI family thioesterase [Alicyclobacillaceae bacterium]|nr:PaaI family thioesterase [Alicyclobacillaceae bacterium]
MDGEQVLDEEQLLKAARDNPWFSELLQVAARRRPTFLASLFDPKVEYSDDQSVVVRIKITELLYNNLEIVHGGMTATLADTAMGLAAYHASGRPSVTLSLTVNYLQPGRGKELIAKASVVHRGGRVITTRCDVFNDEGQIIIQATGTFYALKEGQGMQGVTPTSGDAMF